MYNNLILLFEVCTLHSWIETEDMIEVVALDQRRITTFLFWIFLLVIVLVF